MPIRPKTHRPYAYSPARPHTPSESRPSAHVRGYTRRWQQYRLVYLASHPLCVVADCNQLATDVDHVRPVTGADDPLFWEPNNHQALCHAHHSSKTAKEDRHTGRRRGAKQPTR